MKKFLTVLAITAFIMLQADYAAAFEEPIPAPGIYIHLDNYYMIEAIEIQQVSGDGQMSNKTLDQKDIRNSMPTRQVFQRVVYIFPDFASEMAYDESVTLTIIFTKRNGEQYIIENIIYSWQQYLLDYNYNPSDNSVKKGYFGLSETGFFYHIENFVYLISCLAAAAVIRIVFGAIFKIKPNNILFNVSLGFGALITFAAMILAGFYLLNLLIASIFLLIIFSFLEYILYRKKLKDYSQKKLIIFTGTINIIIIFVYIALYNSNKFFM